MPSINDTLPKKALAALVGALQKSPLDANVREFLLQENRLNLSDECLPRDYGMVRAASTPEHCYVDKPAVHWYRLYERSENLDDLIICWKYWPPAGLGEVGTSMVGSFQVAGKNVK
jgi:hypothetical protein